MDKIKEALIDPKWEWGTISIGEINLSMLTLVHPNHGDIVCILAKETKNQIIEGLTKLA